MTSAKQFTAIVAKLDKTKQANNLLVRRGDIARLYLLDPPVQVKSLRFGPPSQRGAHRPGPAAPQRLPGRVAFAWNARRAVRPRFPAARIPGLRAHTTQVKSRWLITFSP